MELKFNIVCVPGTVRRLQPFVLSLVKWSDSSFRLVSNGCSPEEIRLLQQLCQGDRRLEFLALPYETLVEHGQALTYLQTLEHSAHFCFMDSDILATGDFLKELNPYVDLYAGVFSCPATYCTDEDQIMPGTFKKMMGRFHTTDKGVCVGSSYLAIYDNSPLTRIVRSTGIGFVKYVWRDIPARHQAQIADMGLRKELYDTGKLLNLLLLAQGARLVFVDSPSLQHIGGMSTYVAQQDRLLTRRMEREERLAQTLTGIERLDGKVMREAKTRTGRYFAQLLHCLFEDQPPPAMPDIGNTQIEQRIERLTKDLTAAFEEFKEQLI